MSPNLASRCALGPLLPPRLAFGRILPARSSSPGKAAVRARARGERSTRASLCGAQRRPIPGCAVILHFANELACVPCARCLCWPLLWGSVVKAPNPANLASAGGDDAFNCSEIWELALYYRTGTGRGRIKWITSSAEKQKMREKIVSGSDSFPFCIDVASCVLSSASSGTVPWACRCGSEVFLC